MLSRVEGYCGSDLRRRAEAERRYRLRDFWRSHREFEAFREGSSDAIASFREVIAMAALVEREELLGTYYELGAAGEGDDLVPAAA